MQLHPMQTPTPNQGSIHILIMKEQRTTNIILFKSITLPAPSNILNVSLSTFLLDTLYNQNLFFRNCR